MCVPMWEMWGLLMCMYVWEVCVHVCARQGVFECAYVWWLPGIPMWSQAITWGPTSSWDGQAASGGWPGGGSQWHTNGRWAGQWDSGGDTSRIFCIWRKMGGLEVSSPKNKNLPGKEELGKARLWYLPANIWKSAMWKSHSGFPLQSNIQGKESCTQETNFRSTQRRDV